MLFSEVDKGSSAAGITMTDGEKTDLVSRGILSHAHAAATSTAAMPRGIASTPTDDDLSPFGHTSQSSLSDPFDVDPLNV